MAVYCGVCAVQISSATENGGSFPVQGDFGGWDVGDDQRQARIQDTCERCFARLARAVAEAAKSIICNGSYTSQVSELRARMLAERKRQLDFVEARRIAMLEFERSWRQKK